MCHAGPSSLVFFWGMLNSLRWWFTDCSVRRIKKTNVQSLYWSFGFTPSTCYWVHIRVLWSSLPAPLKAKHFLSVNYDSWWQHQMSLRELRHDRPSEWFSKSRGLSASVLSSPPPPCSFTYAIFRAVFSLRSCPLPIIPLCLSREFPSRAKEAKKKKKRRLISGYAVFDSRSSFFAA